jgi:hypothetical protein
MASAPGSGSSPERCPFKRKNGVFSNRRTFGRSGSDASDASPPATPPAMNVGAHQSFWISRGDRRLWAALHPAATPTPSRRGVLFVPPLLHELPRSLRLLCEMATSLASLGIPCLRFAYFGTGDSEGSAVEADFASMSADLEQAAAELLERSDCTELVLLAFRSGALPAHHWIGRTAKPPALVVLWDPVLEGAAWREGLEQVDAGKRLPAEAASAGPEAGSHESHLMGYPVPSSFRFELDAARWSGPGRTQSVPVWIVGGTAESASLPSVERSFTLPPGTPGFGTGFTMAADDTLTPRLEQVVRACGAAVLDGC